ncbi:hypothetical protein LG634_08940 [Streptomyces bambusae]|uniref:hypothetical protein n=1 Tax=Streptomyces bambusae TaxID=1550616 RepID=UPI001CFEC42E|nr:hypothetical protein [Streptomyces bambusae]MCB5164953.1 hypothetical protein [Streptomyces bambusae]
MRDMAVVLVSAAVLLLVYHAVRRSGAGLRAAVAVGAVANAAVLYGLAVTQPAGSVVTVAVVSAVGALHALLSAGRDGLRRVAVLDPAGLRGLVRTVAGLEPPQLIGLFVPYTGGLMVTAFGDDARPEGRQFRVPAGDYCPFCLVEEQARALTGPDADALLAEYRGHVRRGSSRHVLIRRMEPGDPWTGRLRDRVGYRTPPRSPACPAHAPTGPGAGSGAGAGPGAVS